MGAYPTWSFGRPDAEGDAGVYFNPKSASRPAEQEVSVGWANVGYELRYVQENGSLERAFGAADGRAQNHRGRARGSPQADYVGGGSAAAADVDKPSKQWMFRNMESVKARRHSFFLAVQTVTAMITNSQKPWNFLILP